MEDAPILGPDVGYVDALNFETTEAARREQQKKQKRFCPIRPSAAGKCTRELAYEAMMFYGKASYDVNLMDPEVMRLLSLGHYIESHIIKQFEQHLSEMFEVRYKQQMLSFGKLKTTDEAFNHMLEGSLDACFWSEKWKCVVDFKSKKDGFSSFRSTRWDETTEKLSKMECVKQISDNAFYVDNLPDFLGVLHDPFFEANFLQLNLYANSEFLKERGINHAAIIQYNKNTSQLREIRFKPSPLLADKVMRKFERALDAVAANAPEKADKDYILGSMKCAFCPFVKLCWGAEIDGRKEWFKTFAAKTWPTDTAKLGQDGKNIDALVAALLPLSAAEAQREIIEADILKIMAKLEVGKIRTETGDVYEAKMLKSPRPHFELRRAKA